MSQQIALNILDQMGGRGRIATMLGTKRFFSYDDGVAFSFSNKKRSAPNQVKITLDPSDTYTMTFLRVSRNGDFKEKGRFTRIYADQLVEIFERQTGLFLSL